MTLSEPIIWATCYGYISNNTACRGVDAELLPEDVQRFSGCVVVNGDLIFNFITYDKFV